MSVYQTSLYCVFGIYVLVMFCKMTISFLKVKAFNDKENDLVIVKIAKYSTNIVILI